MTYKQKISTRLRNGYYADCIMDNMNNDAYELYGEKDEDFMLDLTPTQIDELNRLLGDVITDFRIKHGIFTSEEKETEKDYYEDLKFHEQFEEGFIF